MLILFVDFAKYRVINGYFKLMCYSARRKCNIAMLENAILWEISKYRATIKLAYIHTLFCEIIIDSILFSEFLIIYQH